MHTPSNNCYNRGCRRPECKEAHRIYIREYRATVQHRLPSVPIDPVADHLNALLKTHKVSDIEEAIGHQVTRWTLYHIRDRSHTKVQAFVADLILGVEL